MSNKFLFSLLLGVSLVSTSFKTHPPSTKVEYVYICEGPYSKVYHRSNECRGLSHCSTKIYRVTLEEAKKLDRRPCKIEYR
jgi:hypothetical protein